MPRAPAEKADAAARTRVVGDKSGQVQLGVLVGMFLVPGYRRNGMHRKRIGTKDNSANPLLGIGCRAEIALRLLVWTVLRGGHLWLDFRGFGVWGGTARTPRLIRCGGMVRSSDSSLCHDCLDNVGIGVAPSGPPEEHG